MADNTVIKHNPYTLTYDGSWTVKKTVKSKDGKEREEVVGYYNTLEGAVWYGLINDSTKDLGETTVGKAAERMDATWQDVKATLSKAGAVP